MKKILLTFLAIAGLMTVTSCQKEPVPVSRTGEVDFSITAGIPGEITTYAPGDGQEAFSHQGGANNVDPAQYDLRYILEVYDGETVAYRDVKYVDADFLTSTASFSARLLAKSYTFVLWADFVKTPASDGTYSDLYYSADDLRAVSYTDAVDGAALSTDIADAYTARKVIDLSAGSKDERITLTRPFGKIRLLATDKDIVNNVPEVPVSVKLDFGGAKFPDSFNALTGDVSGEFAVNVVTTSAVKEDAKSVDGVTEYTDAYLLGYVYVFASVPQAAYPVDVTVYSDAAAANQIGYRELTGIPVSANKLTTVVGNFYSNEGGLEVTVEDMFSNGEDEISIPDAVSASSLDELKQLLADPEIDAIALSSDMEINETITVDRPVLLTGGVTITTSGNNPVFTLSAEGVVLDGLNFYQDSNVSQNIITVTASNSEIRNCTFEGKYADGNAEVTRAIVPNAGVAITVEGNTFRNIRQPGYFEATGTVLRNNYVEGTRGFVICSNHEMTVEGNSFLNNAVDIAIIANGSPYCDIYDDVRTLSENNNGAFVENQVTKVSAIGNGNSKALADALKNATAIELLAGTFELSEGITIPSGTTVSGSSRDEVTLSMAEHSGDSWAVTLAGTLKNVSVIYDTERVAGTAWTTNPGGVLFNAGGQLESCSVSYFRNGLYANNIEGITISGNIVDANRTGIQFANAVGATVTGNTISNNETMGVLLQFLSANNGETPTFTQNVFDGNWYSDFENRWGTEYAVDLSGNTFTAGSTVLKVQSSTGEPGSNVTFTKPASQVANIVTALASNIIGEEFFPITNTTNQKHYTDLQSAVDDASENDIISVSAGTYVFSSSLALNKPVTIKGAGADQTILDFSAPDLKRLTMSDNSECWAFNGGIVVSADNVTVDGFTIKGGEKTEMGAIVLGINDASKLPAYMDGKTVISSEGYQQPSGFKLMNCKIISDVTLNHGIFIQPYGSLKADFNTYIENVEISGFATANCPVKLEDGNIKMTNLTVKDMTTNVVIGYQYPGRTEFDNLVVNDISSDSTVTIIDNLNWQTGWKELDEDGNYGWYWVTLNGFSTNLTDYKLYNYEIRIL